MRKKIIPIINKYILTVLLALGSTAVGMADAHLVVLPDGIVDLGEFEEKYVQTREVFVKNSGDEPLTILKTFSSCSCTRVQYSSAPIAPGDSAAITVVFDGRHRKPGAVRKVIRLTSNADNSIVGVLVKGDIVKPFQK